MGTKTLFLIPLMVIIGLAVTGVIDVSPILNEVYNLCIKPFVDLF